MKPRELITEEELNILFPNKVQREVFFKLMTRLINVITERTVLCSVVTLKE